MGAVNEIYESVGYHSSLNNRVRPNPIGLDGLPERYYKYLPLRNPIDVKRSLRLLLCKQAWFASFEQWPDGDEGTQFRFDEPTLRQMMRRAGCRDYHQRGRVLDRSARNEIDAIVDRRMSVATPDDLMSCCYTSTRQAIGAFCMTDLEDNQTLWNQFGASGNGICFELQTCGYWSSEDDFIIKVHYDGSPAPVVNPNVLSAGKLLQHSVATKNPHYAVESEWRLLVRGQHPGLHVLRTLVVTRVISGPCFDMRYENLIKRACIKSPDQPSLWPSRWSRLNTT